MKTVLYPGAPYRCLPGYGGNLTAISPSGRVSKYCSKCGKVMAASHEPVYQEFGWYCLNCELGRGRQ